jgi:hypothetical protein
MAKIEYTLNDVQQIAEHHEMTPDAVLQRAGIDSVTHYLVEQQGGGEISFEGKGGVPLYLTDHAIFRSVRLKHAIDYTVNDVQQETKSRELSPNEILRNAGIDPELYFLVERFEEDREESFRGKGSTHIRVREQARFYSVRLIIEYTVDTEKQTTTEYRMTPDQILSKAEIDPATHWLEQLRDGAPPISYKDKGTVPISIREHERFISVASGPKPVS